MKQISIATCFDYNIPFDEQLEMISSAGFNHFSISGRYEHSNILDKENRKLIKEQLKEYGLSIDTIHGCGTDNPNCDKILNGIIEAAKELDVPIIVVHPVTGFEICESQIEQKVKSLLDTCARFRPTLEQNNIKIAVENMHPDNATEVLRRGLPQLDPEVFGFCYDSSHDQVDGPRDFNLLEEFGNRVISVHLSDRIRPFIDHAIPGEGFVDFDEICRLLKHSKYSNPVMLELMIMNSYIKDHGEFLKRAYIEGEKILNIIQ